MEDSTIVGVVKQIILLNKVGRHMVDGRFNP